MLYCYLTQGCNLACRHCWLKPKLDPDGTRFPVMDPEMFAGVVAEARPLGLQSVKLTGGEPLLNPKISEFLALIREAEMGLVVETNGVLATPALAADIARCPNAFVSVSLDGPDAKTHERIRGVKGCFDKACDGIRNLIAVGLAPQMIMTVMRDNIEQIDTIIGLAEDLGCGSVKFNVVQPTARGEHIYDDPQVVTVEELIALGRHVELDLAPQTDVRLIFDVPSAFHPLSRIARAEDGGNCGILGILGLLPTGTYALCGIGEQIPELAFGTAGKDDLATIWREHPTLQRLRELIPDGLEGICGRCLMKQTCLGSCIAQNYYRTGSLSAPYWFCECAEAAGLFPKSRLAE